MMNQADFTQILADQDRMISDLGVHVWVGMEPTFTRRFTESAEWLSEALGEDKLTYAYALLKEVRRLQPGGIVLHTLGRQYAGEALPRWSIGYYQLRSGHSLPKRLAEGSTEGFAEGLADICLGGIAGELSPAGEDSSPHLASQDTLDMETYCQVLNQALKATSWHSVKFEIAGEFGHRILFRCDGDPPLADIQAKSALARPSVHSRKIPLGGLTDELALQGDFLLCLEARKLTDTPQQSDCLVIELPAMTDVESFRCLLQCISRSAQQTGIRYLYLQGFPPPVDETVSWTTITPDPAVIEINQAPAENAVDFYRLCKLYYGAARTAGLHSHRLNYNGVVSDSGGGGQFTLGGPSALSSPFFHYPRLLPRLIRYVNAHPALSYWFAPPSIGSSSQSPRCDEGVRESFNELALALDQLEIIDGCEPEFLWRSLNPFLVDSSGNPHRSELNIEKLWNPYLPGRGRLGLVEFRAFRMSRSPECAAAIAVLLRSIVAMLSKEDKVRDLVDHGSRLHDKFALPFYLRADLNQIFKDLDESGIPLHDSIKAILLHEPVRSIGKAEFHGCCVELEQALEFWPLMGDVASQEGGGSRLVDASTTRLQLTLRPTTHHPSQLQGWEVWLEGHRLPLRIEQDHLGPVMICGLRYRNFTPQIGFHPGIKARNDIRFIVAHRGLQEALQVTYYEWHPEGLAYPGLPVDLDDAAQRRAQRFVTQVVIEDFRESPKNPPSEAVSEYCVDLRRLPV